MFAVSVVEGHENIYFYSRIVSSTWCSAFLWFMLQLVVLFFLFVTVAKLQIREGIEDNSKIISLIFQRKHTISMRRF